MGMLTKRSRGLTAFTAVLRARISSFPLGDVHWPNPTGWEVSCSRLHGCSAAVDPRALFAVSNVRSLAVSPRFCTRYPEDPIAAAKVDAVIDCMFDIQAAIRPSIYETSAQRKVTYPIVAAPASADFSRLSTS